MTDVLAHISAIAATKPPDEVIAELVKSLPAGFVEGLLAQGLAERAVADTPEGFEAFYMGVHGGKMLDFNYGAFKKQHQAHKIGDIFLYLGFRGCRKTSTFDITQATWLHGLYPKETGIITGANDPNANLIAKSIAQIIEFHPFFKLAFPHVIPDPDKGWGEKGYFLRDNRMSREQWTEIQAKVNDPSFIGGGYKSSNINGKHPSLYLFSDDLHDIDTEKSATENENIKNVFFSQILKTAIREGGKFKTRISVTGVPFTRDDTYATLKGMGNTTFHQVPVMTRAMEGEGTFIDGLNPKTGKVYDDIVGWWHLLWPENFDAKAIINARSEGKKSFWQMLMLDIDMAKGGGLKYYTYPHENINPAWQSGAGVDWATLGLSSRPNPGRDFFGMAIGCKTPLNQLVVKDVILEQVSQADAERHIVAQGKNSPNWRGTLIEGDGGGETFAIDVVRRNPGILIQWPKSGGVSKATRQQKMSPWLENGTVLISDAQTPGLSALRNALEDFPDGNNDVRDALYWLCRNFPECLLVSVPDDELPNVRRIKKTNPWMALANRR